MRKTYHSKVKYRKIEVTNNSLFKIFSMIVYILTDLEK